MSKIKSISSLFWVLLVSLIAACGGGGGGDGGACRQYCDYACNKAGNCFGLTADQRTNCSLACFDRTQELNRSDDSCRQTQSSVEQMSCAELATALGLRSATGERVFVLPPEIIGQDLGDCEE